MSQLKPISAIDAAKFLREASYSLEREPTGGEDSSFWANVTNAQTCIRIAEMLERAFDLDPADTTEDAAISARQKGGKAA